MFCLHDKKTAGFTLIELTVAISIVAILMLFAIAPYNLYSDKARVRLSAERIEQAISKARLFASTGYSAGDKNQDLIVSVERDGKEVSIERIPATGKWTPLPVAGSNSRILLEAVSLESSVLVAGFGMVVPILWVDPVLPTSLPNRILLVFRAPLWTLEYWSETIGSTPVALASPPKIWVVGIKWVQSGLRSKVFFLP